MALTSRTHSMKFAERATIQHVGKRGHSHAGIKSRWDWSQSNRSRKAATSGKGWEDYTAPAARPTAR